jgi:hypothetical protein
MAGAGIWDLATAAAEQAKQSAAATLNSRELFFGASSNGGLAPFSTISWKGERSLAGGRRIRELALRNSIKAALSGRYSTE